MNTEPTKPAQEEEEDSRVRQIVDLGSSVVTNDHGTVHCLTVIGQIEGHGQAPSGTKTTKYEHVLPLLASIEESQEVDGLLVLLHTMGGDVEAGLAIAEMIAGMTKPTVTLVLGGGHSIGIPLAVSGKVTLMAPSASMTIHPIRMSGLMIAAPQTYHYFERLQDRITRFVAAHSPYHRGALPPADALQRRYGQRRGQYRLRGRRPWPRALWTGWGLSPMR